MKNDIYIAFIRISVYLCLPETLIIYALARSQIFRFAYLAVEGTVDLTIVSAREIRHKILPLSPRLKAQPLNGLVKMYLADKTLF